MNMDISTRELIMRIALDLFALQGYESIGVLEIAKKSGVTKPTLYHYFGSKRGLLDALMDSHGKKLYDAVAEGCVYQHDIVSNLRNVTRSILATATQNEAFFRLHQTLSTSAPNSEGFRSGAPLRTMITERIEQLFEEASADHGNMRGRARVYSYAFQGMCNTWATLLLNKEVEITDEMMNRAVHYFMHGIFS